MRAVRAACDPAGAGVALAAHVLAACPPRPGQIVAGYWPVGDEMDVRPLLEALHARGHNVCLPVTPPLGHPLSFRIWVPGAAFAPERFGTVRPTGAECRPDILFVPLLAWDRGGGRLGYGGGYYDRTLAALDGLTTIGCGYAAQEVACVPMGVFDRRLDGFATEKAVVRVT